MAVDTPRFARLRWESPCPDLISKWRPINFGGNYSPFYRDHSFVFNWWQNGSELKAKVLHNYPYLDGNWGWVVKNDSLYGKPGLAYGKRTDLLSVQIQNEGMLFGNEGFVVFPHQTEDTWFVIGFLNAPAVGNLLNSFCGQHKVSGYVDSIPIPVFPNEKKRELAEVGRDGFESMRQFSTSDESSALFSIVYPAAISLSAGFATIKSTVRQLQECVANLQNKADGIVEESLGIIEKRVSKKIEIEAVETDYIARQLSLWLGCAFGRWDIRYATGEQAAPELPDPFAPLPVCPPGQLQNAQGLPMEKEEVGRMKEEGIWNYPIEIPWDGILVDDPNHPLDIERRVREVIEIIWSGKDGGPTAEAIEHEACEILGVKSLRDYFRKPAGFFADHLKRYSKSRRQAPIYWPLSTASGSYTLWIYYHRLTPDTLYKCLQQFVEPKIREIEQDLVRLRAMDEAGEGGRQTRDQLAKAETLRTELLALRDELAHWAPRWKPNLNDGVQITASPLWKLFLLPKWRKTLEQTWKELDRGDYDWAHLAHTLHPARVREKCKTDRSLAIAHSLEDLCQIQAPAPKKKRGKEVKTTISKDLF